MLWHKCGEKAATTALFWEIDDIKMGLASPSLEVESADRIPLDRANLEREMEKYRALLRRLQSVPPN